MVGRIKRKKLFVAVGQTFPTLNSILKVYGRNSNKELLIQILGIGEHKWAVDNGVVTGVNVVITYKTANKVKFYC